MQVIHLTRNTPQSMLCRRRCFYLEQIRVDLLETSAFLEIHQPLALVAIQLAALILFACARVQPNQLVVALEAPFGNVRALYDERILAPPAMQWLMPSVVEYLLVRQSTLEQHPPNQILHQVRSPIRTVNQSLWIMYLPHQLGLEVLAFQSVTKPLWLLT